MARLRKVGGVLVGVAFAVLVFWIGGEVLARSTSIVDRLNRFPRNIYQRGSDDDLPYRFRSGLSAELFGKPFRTNRFGVRGPEVRVDSQRERILVLGDSVVFGLAVLDDETFPALLQHELATLGRAAVDVINAGVPGYDIAAEAALFESVAPALSPREVLLGVSLNDIGEAPRLNAHGVLTQRPVVESPGWLARHSEFYLALAWGWRAWRNGSLLRPRASDAEEKRFWEALDAFVEREHRAFYAAPNVEVWRRVRRSLTRVRNTARSMNLPLMIIVFPEAYQFAAPPYRDPQQRWLELAAELGIRAIDLWPAFSTAMDEGSGSLFSDNQHPNAAGLAVAARVVARELTHAAPVAGK